jgi:hypothetical protein
MRGVKEGWDGGGHSLIAGVTVQTYSTTMAIVRYSSLGVHLNGHLWVRKILRYTPGSPVSLACPGFFHHSFSRVYRGLNNMSWASVSAKDEASRRHAVAFLQDYRRKETVNKLHS